jgi:hypothetical protein
VRAVGLAAEEDVAGLEVAANDALGVRGGERRGDLHQERQHLVQRQLRVRAQGGVQRLALEELHDDVRAAVIELPQAEDVDDVAVADGVDGLGLGDESFDVACVGGRPRKPGRYAAPSMMRR